MLDIIAMWVGYAIIIASGFVLTGVLLFISYLLFDTYLKKTIGWNNVQTRVDIYYFIKHKKEIQEYIKKMESKG